MDIRKKKKDNIINLHTKALIKITKDMPKILKRMNFLENAILGLICCCFGLLILTILNFSFYISLL